MRLSRGKARLSDPPRFSYLRNLGHGRQSARGKPDSALDLNNHSAVFYKGSKWDAAERLESREWNRQKKEGGIRVAAGQSPTRKTPEADRARCQRCCTAPGTHLLLLLFLPLVSYRYYPRNGQVSPVRLVPPVLALTDHLTDPIVQGLAAQEVWERCAFGVGEPQILRR